MSTKPKARNPSEIYFAVQLTPKDYRIFSFETMRINEYFLVFQFIR